MIFENKVLILILMLWLHVVDDYYLQGVLANLKQQDWWRKNAPAEMYEADYKVALRTHAFSWSFMIMLPAAVCIYLHAITATAILYIIWLIWNTFIHYIVDDLKANMKAINLKTDQLIHVVQVVATWLVMFIAF